jgi:putative transposase
MRHHGLRALAGRKFKPCTTDSSHSLPIAPTLLQQEFVATAPNQIWLADITYIPTEEGWLYLAAVLDMATRKIVGWSMRDHIRAELPLAAHADGDLLVAQAFGIGTTGVLGGFNRSLQHR